MCERFPLPFLRLVAVILWRMWNLKYPVHVKEQLLAVLLVTYTAPVMTNEESLSKTTYQTKEQTNFSLRLHPIMAKHSPMKSAFKCSLLPLDAGT